MQSMTYALRDVQQIERGNSSKVKSFNDTWPLFLPSPESRPAQSIGDNFALAIDDRHSSRVAAAEQTLVWIGSCRARRLLRLQRNLRVIATP